MGKVTLGRDVEILQAIDQLSASANACVKCAGEWQAISSATTCTCVAIPKVIAIFKASWYMAKLE